MRIARWTLALAAAVAATSCASTRQPEPGALLAVLDHARTKGLSNGPVAVDSVFGTASRDSVPFDTESIRALRAAGVLIGSRADLTACFRSATARPPVADVFVELAVVKQTSGTLLVDVDYSANLKARTSRGCGPPANDAWGVAGGLRYSLRKIGNRWEVISVEGTWIT